MQQILQPVIQNSKRRAIPRPSAFSVPISDLPPLSDELILGLLAKESPAVPTMRLFLEYFNEHPDLAERSAFAKNQSKFIHIFVQMNLYRGFIRHDMYLELWEGNYLTKTAQVNLTWDAVAAKIADLIEQGGRIVPTGRLHPCSSSRWRAALPLLPEDSEKAGAVEPRAARQNIDLCGRSRAEQARH